MRRTLSLRSPAWLALAVTLAACGDAPSGPEEETFQPFGTIMGKVVAPNQVTFDNLTARVVWEDQNVTAPVATDGSFTVEIPEAVAGFGALTIEPAAGASVHPAWVLLSPGDVDGGSGTIVLTPTTWTPESGDYAGIEIPIDPQLAADTRVMPSFWGFYFPFSQEGFLQSVTDNTLWAAEFRGWPADAYPLPVAFDHDFTDEPITAADSVIFWGHVDRMEEALGWDAFRPARVEEVQILGGSRRANQAILVQIDTTLQTRGLGLISRPNPQIWNLTADATSWSGTPVERIDVLSADITYGLVKLDSISLVTDRQLVIHEMMHTLGAGHGCSWGSVQTYCASLLTDIPSAADVGHLRVMAEVRALELQYRSRWGLIAAVLGQRVVTLGLSPTPRLNVLYGPASVPADFYGVPNG
jgi:hypothetical protein